MIPKLKNTTSRSARMGSGKVELGSSQQQVTTKVYTPNRETSIPNFDNAIERAYWMRRCEDDLYRAWQHFKGGDLKRAQHELDDYDQSMHRIQEIRQ